MGDTAIIAKDTFSLHKIRIIHFRVITVIIAKVIKPNMIEPHAVLFAVSWPSLIFFSMDTKLIKNIMEITGVK
jgi:hypothetical protein